MGFSTWSKKLQRSFRCKMRWIVLVSILSFFIYFAVQQYEQAQNAPEHELVLAIHAEHHENSYFGIDEEDHLSLFAGEPESSEQIRTFFQLDIEYLESSLPRETVEQLYTGIRVTDEDEFNSVLSTLSPYAVELTDVISES